MSTQSDSGAVSAAPPPTSPPSKLVYKTLKYLLSTNEYAYLRKKAPKGIARNVATTEQFEALTGADQGELSQFGTSAVRASLRVFLAGQGGFAAVALVMKLLGKTAEGNDRKKGGLSANTRTSLAAAVVVLVHRLLFRFFARLRTNLLSPTAKEFRRKHPRTYKLLVNKYAPSVGAALSGAGLAIMPEGAKRVTITVYLLTRVLEYAYNGADLAGMIGERPWWFGSWLLFPLTSAQLFHAFVFDRDCFPKEFGNVITTFSDEYVQVRPETFPKNLAWPAPEDIVDGLSTISGLRYPPFKSPTIFSTSKLPPSLSKLSPLISPAHPLIQHLECALLHPTSPSCGKTYIMQLLSTFPRIAKIIGAIYTLLLIPKYKSFLKDPLLSLEGVAKSTLLTSTFITGSIATLWGSLCVFQKFLPKTLLPGGRFYLAGLLGGLWAFVDAASGRSNFLYTTRLSILSLWKVGVKHKWWRGVKNGDVILFMVSLAVAGAIHDWKKKAVGHTGEMVIKGLRGSEGERESERAERSSSESGSSRERKRK